MKSGPTGLADELDLGCDRKVKSSIDPVIMAYVTKRMEVPSTEMGKSEQFLEECQEQFGQIEFEILFIQTKMYSS